MIFRVESNELLKWLLLVTTAIISTTNPNTSTKTSSISHYTKSKATSFDFNFGRNEVCTRDMPRDCRYIVYRRDYLSTGNTLIKRDSMICASGLFAAQQTREFERFLRTCRETKFGEDMGSSRANRALRLDSGRVAVANCGRIFQLVQVSIKRNRHSYHSELKRLRYRFVHGFESNKRSIRIPHGI